VFLLEKRVGTDPAARKHLQRIGEQIAAANGIVSSLLDLVRDRPMNPQPLAISEVVARALDLVPRPAGVQVEVVSLAGIQVMGDASLLRQAFVNLVQNAVEACGDTGRVTVEGRMGDGKVEISVEDTAQGLEASVKARLFEPLITTKAKGIGLGLALVRRIVERHGGQVTCESPAGGSARFVIKLPLGAAHA